MAGSTYHTCPIFCVHRYVQDLESLIRACQGCRAAYYLVHSMISSGRGYVQADRQAARNMVQAASLAGLERIIYLGGLAPRDPKLSRHLRSRAEVGTILQSGPVPVTRLRAAMILGSGSVSFEILRYLVDRLPLLIAPIWVRTKVQSICIRNVLNYLVACLEDDRVLGQTFDVCGPDVLSYEELFQIYAQEAGLRRRIILTLPVLAPTLSAYWIHLITPVHAFIARPLAEGLRNTVVCTDNRIRSLFPQDLLDCRQAIRRALEKEQQHIVETSWTDAGLARPPEWFTLGDAPYAGGTVLQEAHRIVLQATPEEIWPTVVAIGGPTGWYFGNFLWRLRGILDKLMGGISLRRGRRDPSDLRVGDALDFWCVLEIWPYNRLVLLAEMKTPGEAVLEFRLVPDRFGRTELQQIGRFLPRGLAGLAYWHAFLPFHRILYSGMLRRLAQAVGRPIIHGPERFDPATGLACFWGPGRRLAPGPAPASRKE